MNSAQGIADDGVAGAASNCAAVALQASTRPSTPQHQQRVATVIEERVEARSMLRTQALPSSRLAGRDGSRRAAAPTLQAPGGDGADGGADQAADQRRQAGVDGGAIGTVSIEQHRRCAGKQGSTRATFVRAAPTRRRAGSDPAPWLGQHGHAGDNLDHAGSWVGSLPGPEGPAQNAAMDCLSSVARAG